MGPQHISMNSCPSSESHFGLTKALSLGGRKEEGGRDRGRRELGPKSWAQARFINRNMETHGGSQARQRRIGKSWRDHSKM